MILLLSCQRFSFAGAKTLKTKAGTSKADASGDAHSRERKFDLGALLGFRLSKLSASIGNLAAQEAGEVAGLTLPEYRVMVVLRSRGPAGVVALQQIMLIDKAWISRTISSLVAKGLVAAAADPADARRTSFSVTPKGRRAADALIERAFKRQGRVLRGLTQAEAGHLMALLARIQDNVDQEGA